MSDDKSDGSEIVDQLASAGKSVMNFFRRVGESDVKTATEELLAKVAGEEDEKPEEQAEAEEPPRPVAVVRPLRPVPLGPSSSCEPSREGE